MSVNTLFSPNNDVIYCKTLNVNGSVIPSPIASNAWTPTVAIVGGIEASSLINLYSSYVQVGNYVTAYSSLLYTSAAGKASFNLTLPVPRSISGNFVNLGQAVGHAIANNPSDTAGPLAGFTSAIVGTQTVQSVIAPDPGQPATCNVNVIFSYSI